MANEGRDMVQVKINEKKVMTKEEKEDLLNQYYRTKRKYEKI